MSFRRAELEAADGFSADMGRVGGRMLHCEDTEFCIRATADRPEAVILHRPEAVVRHYVPAPRTSWSYFRVRCYTEGLAKARISRMVGADRGLASERRYVTRTLPGGIARGLRSGTREGAARAARHRRRPRADGRGLRRRARSPRRRGARGALIRRGGPAAHMRLKAYPAKTATDTTHAEAGAQEQAPEARPAGEGADHHPDHRRAPHDAEAGEQDAPVPWPPGPSSAMGVVLPRRGAATTRAGTPTRVVRIPAGLPQGGPAGARHRWPAGCSPT